VTRKAYGGGYIAMNSSCLGATRVFAWPTAEIAVMSATAAVRVVHRRRLALLPEAERAEAEAHLTAEHELLSGGLDQIVELGALNKIIAPEHTRSALARALAGALCVRGGRGNTPL
jgi:acetyl-CoA/propionyl-CoA carboxylase carboxyl transferase subunit